MNIIRRCNVANNEVKEQLERLNALVDPGVTWIEGREGLSRERTQLLLVDHPATKGPKQARTP